jgi:oxygen-independent coproporphyrinogen-3 oxidase
VEPKTPLDKMIRMAKSPPVDADKQSEHFLLLMQWMKEAGYEHYEISNFAKPGCRSRHNSSYWAMGTRGKPKKYLGLGPAAHSYNGVVRQWNVSNNTIYIDSVNHHTVPCEKEELTITQQVNEYIMTALRTLEGISIDLIEAQFHISKSKFLIKAAKYLNSGLLQEENNCLVLTNEGKLLADGIAADLFF